MRDVTYFPPYSQKENVVTNAVLLLFSQINAMAPDIFAKVISDLIEDEDYLPIGPNFYNQITINGAKSIPDALITQEPFHLYFETKLGDFADDRQIHNHMDAIKLDKKDRPGRSFLIALTRTKIDHNKVTALQKKARETHDNLAFIATTFARIAEIIGDVSAEFRLSVNAMLEEYKIFLAEHDLMPPSSNVMIINPCGTSFKENIKYNIYYDQPERSKKICRFSGLYKDKAVFAVGEVKAVCNAIVSNDGEVNIRDSFALPWDMKSPYVISKDWQQRIADIVCESQYYEQYDKLVRFTIVDKFHKTNFIKTSSGGIQGHRYFTLDSGDEHASLDIAKIFNDGAASSKNVAEALSGKSWV